eukprot:317916-Pelagomonas_calceolata.AAC.1
MCKQYTISAHSLNPASLTTLPAYRHYSLPASPHHCQQQIAQPHEQSGIAGAQKLKSKHCADAHTHTHAHMRTNTHRGQQTRHVQRVVSRVKGQAGALQKLCSMQRRGEYKSPSEGVSSKRPMMYSLPLRTR